MGSRSSGTSTQFTAVQKRRGRRGFLRRMREGWDGVLDWPVLWSALFVITAVWCLLPSGLLFSRPPRVNDVARRDYVAQHDLQVLDVETTAARRQQARDRVLPVYDLDTELTSRVDSNLAALFGTGRQALAKKATEGTRLQAVRDALKTAGIDPPPDSILQQLIDRDFSALLEERLRSLADEVLQRGVVADKRQLLSHRDTGITLRNSKTGEESVQLDLYESLGYPQEVRSLLEVRLRGLMGLTADERSALVDLLIAQLQPNIVPDAAATTKRQDAAANATPPVMASIQQGQVIVRQGDRITATQAAAIAAMDTRRGLRTWIQPAIGELFFVALVGFVLWLGIARDTGVDKPRRRLFVELLLVMTISLIGLRFCIFAARALSESFQIPPLNAPTGYLYAVPFASLAIIAQLLYGRSITVLLSVVFSVVAGRMVGEDGLWFAIYALAASLTATYVLEVTSFKQRSALARAGLAVGGMNILMLLIQAAIRTEFVGSTEGAAQFAFYLLCGFIGGLLAAAIASFAVPVLEILLSVTTEIKLVELANTNLPLLQRLAMEAPGTFQHSLMVANLAKAGCAAIGADPVLAYTGALYHDLGKVFRPEYYVENQRGGQNPHDNLSPAMSALVVVSHVKEGLELAREHHLPQPILDAIAQHHGTRKLSFFYDRALEQATPDSGPVRDEKYRYPGPKPQNRVMAVLMLADGVEAACRTLIDPEPAKLRSVIRAIHDACLKDRQFDETDITLADLRRVNEAFLSLLANVYHRRLDYPGFDFNRKDRRGNGPRVRHLAGT